jgi:hypothetical protein
VSVDQLGELVAVGTGEDPDLGHRCDLHQT